MTYSLIGEDCALSILIGTAWDGSLSPLPIGAAVELVGAQISLLGIAKRFSHHEMVEKTNVKAMGDGRKKHRYHSYEGNMDIDTFVPATGYVIPFSKVGCYVSITFNPLTTLAVPETYNGVIVDWKVETGTDGSATTVTFAVDLNPA